MEIINGGVTAAKGFLAAGAAAGIKYKGRKDMALVYSECPASCAGTFTKNVVKAAPVKRDMALLMEKDDMRAVVLNSGIANACTGEEGTALNEWMAEGMAGALGISKDDVFTASTGVIGEQLVKEPMSKGFALLAKSMSGDVRSGTLAAEAIMTTDTVSKEAAAVCRISGKDVTIGGMSKGSGMIHPDMATMLSVITTDAAISKDVLQKALSDVVDETFNMISVDRDTSTNDTVLALANGLAGNEPVMEGSEGYAEFCGALKYVAESLAKKMAADGEGATKLLEAKVVNAKSVEDARTLARSVISSNLVKTAIYGSDANWGRILCALGYSGAAFDPDAVDIGIASENGSLTLVKNGKAEDYSEEYASQVLSGGEVTVTCDMKAGGAKASAWGCDLTHEYIKINGDYRS